MRSVNEITFRLWQEAINLTRYAVSPKLSKLPRLGPLAMLPDPEEFLDRIRRTVFAREVEVLAESILARKIPLLALCPQLPFEIPWRRDWLNGQESGLAYFRRIPYLNAQAVGDHKFIWELNRHQHLVVLAQAFRLTGRHEFLDDMTGQVKAWRCANPCGRGINWTSALEVAFRALSWIWVYHLTAVSWEEEFRRDFLESLYQHACHLRNNLSVYFSPNTHLLGEAVALHAIAALFPEFPRSTRWERTARELIWRQMQTQVHEDGSHFEQSTYYHVYALDLFLFHQTLAETPTWYRDKLARMADFLEAMQGPMRTLPLIGDDDGGRLFHPYGDRDRFGRSTLATASLVLGRQDWRYEEEDVLDQAVWWLGGRALGRRAEGRERPHGIRWFPGSGLCVMNAGSLQAIVDAGPFGPWSAGHSHSDTLSVIARSSNEELLVDSGAYTYVGDPQWRDWFRGSAAHNTVRIDGKDQADHAGAFRWCGKPLVRCLERQGNSQRYLIGAECLYRDVRHRRRVLLAKDALVIVDDLDGGLGEHLVEQFWHTGVTALSMEPGVFQIGARYRLAISPLLQPVLEEGGEHGWRSRVFGERSAAAVIWASGRFRFPLRIATVLAPQAVRPMVSEDSQGVLTVWANSIVVHFTK